MLYPVEAPGAIQIKEVGRMQTDILRGLLNAGIWDAMCPGRFFIDSNDLFVFPVVLSCILAIHNKSRQ